jgi:hypothetical protein
MDDTRWDHAPKVTGDGGRHVVAVSISCVLLPPVGRVVA